jgi:uncharacterized C2H2 Zn-finger protein
MEIKAPKMVFRDGQEYSCFRCNITMDRVFLDKWEDNIEWYRCPKCGLEYKIPV